MLTKILRRDKEKKCEDCPSLVWITCGEPDVGRGNYDDHYGCKYDLTWEDCCAPIDYLVTVELQAIASVLSPEYIPEQDLMWVVKDGLDVKLCDMSDEHLCNAYKHFMSRDIRTKIRFSQYLKAFPLEIKRRKNVEKYGRELCQKIKKR